MCLQFFDFRKDVACQLFINFVLMPVRMALSIFVTELATSEVMVDM